MPIKSKHLVLFAVLSLFAMVLAACGTTASGSPGEPAEEMDMVEGEDMSDMEHEDGDEHDDSNAQRIPNNGAVIRLIAPEDGAVIEGGEVEFEIEVENFVLGEDGNHWHIYIDGDSWGMVLGDTTTQVLRGIPAGEHHVSVFLSNGDHQDLEDHDSADITIE